MKNFNIYLPNGVKACYTHSNVDVWKDAPLRDGKYDFTTKQIEDMVELLRNPDIKGTTIPRSKCGAKYQNSFRTFYKYLFNFNIR